jgi:hypothetical protein
MAYLKPTAGTANEGRTVAGAPVAGTDEIQTLTVAGAPTTGTFKLVYKGQITAPITWSTTNNTLRDRVDAALGALSTIGGASNVTTAVGTMTLGVGTLTITFVANLAKLNVPLITVAENTLDGSGTVVIATTTAGVTATHRGAPKGAMVTDTDNGVWYQNTGTVYAPTWTAVDVASVAGELTDLAAAIPTAAVAAVAGLGIAIAAVNPTAIGAATPAAVAGATPAGGTGATAGAYDTAANRDILIATVAEIKARLNEETTLTTDLKARQAQNLTELTELKLDIGTLQDTVVEIKTQLNALLVALRTAAIVTP